MRNGGRSGLLAARSPLRLPGCGDGQAARRGAARPMAAPGGAARTKLKMTAGLHQSAGIKVVRLAVPVSNSQRGAAGS